MKRMVNALSTSISRVTAAGSARKSSSVDDVPPPIKGSFIGRTPTKKSSIAGAPNETFPPRAVDYGDDASMNSVVDSKPFLDEQIGIASDGEVEVSRVEEHPIVPIEVAKQMEAAIEFCNNLYDHVFRAPQFGGDNVNNTYSGALKTMADCVSDEDLERIGGLSRAMVIETLLECGFEEALDPTRRREVGEDNANNTYSGALKAISAEDLELIGVVSREMLIETMLDGDFEEALDPTRRKEFAEWRRRNFPEQDDIREYS